MTTKISSDNIQETTLDTLGSPKIASIGYPGNDTAANPAGGQTIILNGSGFALGASVIINEQVVGVVVVVSTSQITFVSPALSTGSYTLYVVNTDGSTAIAVPGIQYSGTPTWSTSAGSLGSEYETIPVSVAVSATGDDPIIYSLHSGTLPIGLSLNSANGAITGTPSTVEGSTTYTFTLRASDNEQQDTDRQFSYTINPDVVTWSSPANNSTITSQQGVIFAQELSASSFLGYSISYSANTLPTGLSIVGANITGTPTIAANSTSLITAIAATSSKTASLTLNFAITPPTMSATGGTVTTVGDYKIHTFTTNGTFQITAAPANTSFEVLIVAGGGAGSYAYAGGGGAGGVLYGSLNSAVGNWTATVGAGGTYTSVGSPLTTNGSNSSVVFNGTTYIAIGGGAGGGWWEGRKDGGSGGGAGGVAGVGPESGGAALQTSQNPLTGYGNAGGGASRSSNQPGGGGGGAGAAGAYAGSGGIGIVNPITGSTSGQNSSGTYYVAGGGGGTFGAGGLGGGGAGGNSPTKQNGTVNTGGGGGGGYNNDGGTNGGSGIVIFRYKYQ